MAEKLSKAQFILLAVSYAAESQLPSLQHLHSAAAASGSLPPELVLRILLTYLPAITPSAQYASFVKQLAIDISTDISELDLSLDLSAVQNIPDAVADKKLRQLTLLPLSAPTYPVDGPDDLLTRFIYHRAHRIDEETGLLAVIADLVEGFVQHSQYLRLWYLSAVLPLYRLRHELYPNLDVVTDLSIPDFEAYDGKRGTALLLSGATSSDHEIVSEYDTTGTIGRDLRMLIGPWLYAHAESRKRRRLNDSGMINDDETGNQAQGGSSEHISQHDTRTWDTVYMWLLRKAVHDFPMATAAVEQWDGPEDLDLGTACGDPGPDWIGDARTALRKRYAQSALAICFAVEDDTEDAIAGAHGILVRLATLLDFEPPPDLATSVEQLPRLDRHAVEIEEAKSMSILDVDNLMRPDHPLTAPEAPPFMLLQMLVYSAYQFAGLGNNISILNVTKLKYFSTADEQLNLLQRILKRLGQGRKKDDEAWQNDRGRLLWLWNWSIDPGEEAKTGSGPLGDILRDTLEKEILVTMIATGNYQVVKDIYLSSDSVNHRLTHEDIKDRILSEAIKNYDHASNGNRTRGSMKKASDIILAFGALFPGSLGFRRASSLLTATHSMSYYSLILQHGIPFQPVNIRLAPDPLSLLEQILEQNAKAYTKLDDLIDTGRNLAIALPPSSSPVPVTDLHSLEDLSVLAKNAERRVIFMCISSALQSHDFDTAYSYLSNRLSPNTALADSETSSEKSRGQQVDDISWRAALLAGRYRPAPTSTSPDINEQIRRLEQRTELLSLALRLAPLPALTEILNVYRRCEEEMASLVSQREAANSAHDDILARQRGGIGATTNLSAAKHASDIPGGFDALGLNEGRTYGQDNRRDLGRLYDRPSSAASANRGGPSSRVVSAGNDAADQAPVGLFDLASGAAAALRRQAFPLRRGGTPAPSEPAPSPPPTTTAAASASSAWKPPPPPHQAGGGETDDEGDDWGAGWGGDADNGDDGTEGRPTDANRRGPAAEGDADEDGGAWGWNEDAPDEGNDDDGSTAWTARRSTDSRGSAELRASSERVRRRDVVASAVSGSLASGIGWVLGATPAANTGGQQQQQQQQGGRR